MRVNASIDSGPQARGIFPRGGARIVEKINATSILTRDPGDAALPYHEQKPDRIRAHAYQNGTNIIAPLWDGPRLSSAFVAQLLGQLLAQGARPDADHLAAARAYARADSGAHGLRARLLNRQD